MPAIPPPMMQRSVWTLVDLDSPVESIGFIERGPSWAISPENTGAQF